MNFLIGGTLGFSFFKQSLKMLSIVFIIIFSLDFLLQAISELEDLNKDYNFYSAVKYLGYISLGRFCEIFPLCCVISAILSYGLLSDSGELTAARVLGKSLFSIILDILKPIFFLLALTLFFLEFITPSLEQKAINLKYGNLTISEQSQWLYKSNNFVKFKAKRDSLESIVLYKLNEDKSINEIISAESGELLEKGWKLKKPKSILNNKELNDYFWKDGPEYGFNENLGRKEMSLTKIYKILKDAGPTRERNMISYEFWKKLFEPISAIAIIVFALALSNKLFGLNRNLERLLFGVLVAYGFNLFLKVFGNIAIINGFSPGVAIALPSILILLIGYRIIRYQ